MKIKRALTFQKINSILFSCPYSQEGDSALQARATAEAAKYVTLTSLNMLPFIIYLLKFLKWNSVLTNSNDHLYKLARSQIAGAST